MAKEGVLVGRREVARFEVITEFLKGDMDPMGSVGPITTIPSPSMTQPPECTVTAQPGGGFGALTTSCGFYQDMSNRTGCNDPTQYPIGYGYKYCVQFGALAQQVPELAPWIGQIHELPPGRDQGTVRKREIL